MLNSPLWVVNSAEKITEADQLTRALARFLRRPWCLPREGGRFRNSENRGEYAQMTWSPGHIAATDLRAVCKEKVQQGRYYRPRPRSGAKFECVALAGVFLGRVAKSPGKLTEAAPPTWHPVQFIWRRRYFLCLFGHFRRGNNLGNNGKLALRAETGPFLSWQFEEQAGASRRDASYNGKLGNSGKLLVRDGSCPQLWSSPPEK